MGNESEKKQSWFEGVSKEFKRINWAPRNLVIKQSIAVVSVSVVLGVIITVVDFLIQHGVDILVK
ncbi:MAG: preprotein translocase subunit SecE [Lachnospiraceae bacterium]|jgi:preprotein translocase subunit SecE|nr:preprotein translocase subunit SecE [Lachnospiraceae bacterium]